MDNVIQEDPLTCDLRVGDLVEVMYRDCARINLGGFP